MRNKRKLIIAVCIVLIVLIVLSLAVSLAKYVGLGNSSANETTALSGDDEESAIYYQGKKYQYNKDLINVLFLGIDTSGEVEIQDMPGYGGQSDSILLLSMNKTDETVRLLQISRDTMTEVDIFDVFGEYLTSIEAQVATQYAYGNGEKSSCWAAKKTVSELLYNLPIDAYISMNLEGIPVANDAVGGVTLTLTQDATEIDQSFVAGATVTLNGDQAEAFVRYRDTDVSGSNQDRMDRQMQYLTAFFDAARTSMGEKKNYYETFFQRLEPYTVTDMSAEQINQLASCDFLKDEIESVPGTVQAGEEHDEFYVDEDALYALIIDMFYVEDVGE